MMPAYLHSELPYANQTLAPFQLTKSYPLLLTPCVVGVFGVSTHNRRLCVWLGHRQATLGELVWVLISVNPQLKALYEC